MTAAIGVDLATNAVTCATPRRPPIRSRQRIAVGANLVIYQRRATGRRAASSRLSAVRVDRERAGVVTRMDFVPGAVDPRRLARGNRIRALVNADYFTYGEGGEQVALGPVVRDGRILQAPPGLRRALALPAGSQPRPVRARVRGRVGRGSAAPPVVSVNWPRSPRGGVGVYTGRWTQPRLPEAAWTVVLRGGRVQRVARRDDRFPAGRGLIAIQVPAGSARWARGLRRGDPVPVSYRLATKSGPLRAAQVVGRGPRIVADGHVRVGCRDRTRRPRTALAWDRAGHTWLATTSAGPRRAESGGVRGGGTTPRTMARWLVAIGATAAVSFDGGGSTIMLARTPALRRIDLAADAWRRPIPVAVAVAVPAGR